MDGLEITVTNISLSVFRILLCSCFFFIFSAAAAAAGCQLFAILLCHRYLISRCVKTKRNWRNIRFKYLKRAAQELNFYFFIAQLSRPVHSWDDEGKMYNRVEEEHKLMSKSWIIPYILKL